MKNKSSKKDKNAAFYSNDCEKEKGGLNLKKKNVICHNCHKKGHYKSECWAPGGGKEGQGPKQKGKGKAKTEEKKDEKKKEAATSAETKGKEKEKVEEAWLAMIDPVDSRDKYYDSEDESSSDFCWSDFEDLADPSDTVNTSSDPYELEELTPNLDHPSYLEHCKPIW